jgi:TolB-like protein
MFFWRELSRRNVFRVAAVYAIVGWLVAQVSSVFAPSLSLPGWVTPLVVFLLILGFPVALVLAWAFEVTPQGIKKARDVPLAASIAHQTRSKLSYIIIGLLAVAVGFLAVDKIGFHRAGQQALRLEAASATGAESGDVGVSAVPQRSIAVLPFENLSAEDAEYFSAGLTEQLINRLVRVPGLDVAPRTSSFFFEDSKELPETIADRLRVRYLLEGSVQLDSEDLVVSIQLIDTRSAYAEDSHRFVRARGEVLEIQDDIVLEVVDRLELALRDEVRSAATTSSTHDPRALDLYWRARHGSETIELARLEEAIGYYEEAILIDPDFAEAHVALADAIQWRQQSAELHPQSGWRTEVHQHIDTALRLDPQLADAHALLGRFLAIHEYDCDGAEREMQRAEALAPDSPKVLMFYSMFYRECGWPPDRIVDYARRAEAAEPFNPNAAIQVSIGYYHLHDYENALKEADAVTERFPNFWVAHWLRSLALGDLGRYEESLEAARLTVEMHAFSDTRATLAVALARVGKRDEAQRIYAELADRDGERYFSALSQAPILMALDRPDAALNALERGFEVQEASLSSMIRAARFVPLHGRPRFERLVDALGQRRRMELFYDYGSPDAWQSAP